MCTCRICGWQGVASVLMVWEMQFEMGKDIKESCAIANENEYGDRAVFYLVHKWGEC